MLVSVKDDRRVFLREQQLGASAAQAEEKRAPPLKSACCAHQASPSVSISSCQLAPVSRHHAFSSPCLRRRIEMKVQTRKSTCTKKKWPEQFILYFICCILLFFFFTPLSAAFLTPQWSYHSSSSSSSLWINKIVHQHSAHRKRAGLLHTPFIIWTPSSWRKFQEFSCY